MPVNNSYVSLFQIDQTGLGMPDPSFYFNSSESIVARYREYLRTVALIFNASKGVATRFVSDVMWFETELARVSVS